ncbi:unnamed protein product [Clonostachys byssicola]|uniref:Uncharacterized protein n=1 Tax=Clonostachys byssicola TaxID=160290 RepID=A0A9N9U2U8_9HYPO|nr:unnamed protein product [Clonostachys byssicola]
MTAISIRKRSPSGCSQYTQRRDQPIPTTAYHHKQGQAATRQTRWKHREPWARQHEDYGHASNKPRWDCAKADEMSHMRYSMERASHLMVNDSAENHLPFPILEYVRRWLSIKHTPYNFGASHRNYLNPNSPAGFFVNGVSGSNQELFPRFISVMLAGLSTAWTNPPSADFDQQYLQDARELVDIMLSESKSQDTRPPYFNFIIGAYVYYDMATSFLVPVNQQLPLNTGEMYAAVLDVGQEYHPIAGYTTDIFYLLGTVGRYCRSVVETGVRDEALEAVLEEELENWEPNLDSPELGLMSNAFRMHGLISLAAICYRRQDENTPQEHLDLSVMMGTDMQEQIEKWQNPRTPPAGDDITDQGRGLEPDDEPESDDFLEAMVRMRALSVIRDLASIPTDNACINLQAIPLFTAGSELTRSDQKERQIVIQRFRELYSMNHLRTNLSALEILPEIWARKDRGETISWLDVMVEKGWSLMLG